MTLDRRAEALRLSEELLQNLELSELKAMELIRKTSRLARLLDDVDAMAWLLLEISGYDTEFEYDENERSLSRFGTSAARRSNRGFRNADGNEQANITSVSGLEATIETGKLRLAAADPPTWVRKSVIENQVLLDKIIGAMHEYVAEVHFELRFGNAVESAFGRLRSETDSAIARLVPDAANMLAAAFELVASDTPEHWSDAAAYCRKLIKAVADKLQPPGSDIGGRANGTDAYINRLVYWIQQRDVSSTAREVVAGDLEFFGRRIDAFTSAGNKGAHAEVLRRDADRFVVGTYMLISDVLRLDASEVAAQSERSGIADTAQAVIQDNLSEGYDGVALGKDD